MKRSGYTLSLDATEPRLVPMIGDKGPEDEMAVRLSHVPPRVCASASERQRGGAGELGGCGALA